LAGCSLGKIYGCYLPIYSHFLLDMDPGHLKSSCVELRQVASSSVE
jgi:hypothetical protein